MPSIDSLQVGATAVITHRVSEGRHADYERWLGEIGPVCRAAPGHLDWQIIRPIAALTGSYTVVIRFDTTTHLREWMESAARKRFIEQVRPLLVADDDYSIHGGLDFWFLPEGALAKAPTRWKQFLVTWSAIFPLVFTAPLVVGPVLRAVGLPAHRAIDTLFGTATVVLLMVYVVMPRYTRLVRGWLFR
jgi:hypothetical protein